MAHRDTLIDIMRDGRIVKWRDVSRLVGEPVSNWVLWDLVSDGTVVKEGGGYRLAEASDDTFDRFIDLSVRHPTGVLCLYTALRFLKTLDRELENLTDEGSTTDTVALPRNSPTLSLPRARIVRWTNPDMFSLGVSEEAVNGNLVRFTSPERTVADLFRPAHEIPRSDALQALSTLATVKGESSVSESLEIARQLGWHRHMEIAVQTVKEMLRCDPPRP